MFDWGEYKRFADGLIPSSGNPSENEIRNYISRLYYYSYHCAMNFAEEKLSFPRKGRAGDRGALIEHLKRLNKWDEAHLILRFTKVREKCDYDDLLPNPIAELQFANELADEFRNKWGRFNIRKKVG